MNKYKFYDTSSLLLKANNLFDDEEPFIISSITLNELEGIKTSAHKSAEIKYTARQVLHALSENPKKYKTCIFTTDMLAPIEDKNLEVINDTKILASAIYWEKNYCQDNLDFITNDLALSTFANLFFGEDSVYPIKIVPETYSGYLDLVFHEEAMTKLYSNLDKNLYNLHINEYLIVRNQEHEIVDKLCWDGTKYRHIVYTNFNSKYFGEVKPIKNDVYQALAADSLINNQITMLKGPAGTGKSYLALSFLLHKLERHKIDKIIIFCNTVATKGSAKLGYYPGSRDEKLLDSQIGNFLSSKLGDKMVIEKMIADGELVLLPMSDIRGYDTTGMRAGVYITEAQNLDINLMKLALQRIGEDSICIIDGDPLTQVDDDTFSGTNNGMQRLSKVFRGQPFYGEVELKQIHRSKIAMIAENM